MKTLGCVPVMLVALMLYGCATTVNTPKQFHQEGLVLYAAGDYVGAMGMFSASLEPGPERPDSLYYLGQCYRAFAREKAEANEYAAAMRYADSALLYLTQAVEAHPGHTPAIRAKSDALDMKGMYEEALAVAEWASKYGGHTARMYVNWAQRLEARRDYDAAELRYTQAISVEPENAWAHARLGAFYQGVGDRAKAIEAYRRAYRIDPLERGVARALRELGAYPSKPVTASSPEPDGLPG